MAESYFSSDTIAAVATSLAGDGGVGILRVSGPHALGVAQAITRGFESPEPRFLHRIEILDSKEAVPIDDGLAVYFPEGQSFTGENVVELQIHGGRFLLQNVLRLLISTKKCRLALPGEFSFRAVRNGKMSLRAAESVAQLIAAKSMFEVKAARRNLGLGRTEEISSIGKKIVSLLARAELSIDFSDQDVEILSVKEVSAQISELLAEVEALSWRLKAVRRLAKGVPVTLVGAPNAGKSTLFNAMLSEERAIVSPEAGTTRDVISEEIQVGHYLVRLSDTAGIRESEGSVEQEGIRRARELLSDSEVVLWLVDASTIRSLADLDEQEIAGISKDAVIKVLTKWDALGEKQRDAILGQIHNSGEFVTASSVTGEGVFELLEAVRKRLDERYRGCLEGFLPTEFQLQMVLKCSEGLTQAKELVETTGIASPELLSASLSGAARALSDVIGETTPDTVLAKIFSEFCIGK